MENSFFKDRVGCSFSEFPIFYAKQMVAPCANFACAWFVSRKIIGRQSVFKPITVGSLGLSLIFFINEFSSRKFSTFYRYEVQEVSKNSLQNHVKGYFSTRFLGSCVKPYGLYVLSKYLKYYLSNTFPTSRLGSYGPSLFSFGLFLSGIRSPEADIFFSVKNAIAELVKPVYILWRDPDRDGEYANYQPPSFETWSPWREKIFKKVSEQDWKELKNFKTIAAISFYSFPSVWLDCYIKKVAQEQKCELESTLSFKEKLDFLGKKINIDDIKMFHEYFLEGQTVIGWAADQYALALFKCPAFPSEKVVISFSKKSE